MILEQCNLTIYLEKNQKSKKICDFFNINHNTLNFIYDYYLKRLINQSRSIKLKQLRQENILSHKQNQIVLARLFQTQKLSWKNIPHHKNYTDNNLLSEHVVKQNSQSENIIRNDNTQQSSHQIKFKIKYAKQYDIGILHHLVDQISVLKKMKVTQVESERADLWKTGIQSRVPEISLQKTTSALDPSVFTTWLINQVDNNLHKLKLDNISDISLESSNKIVRNLASSSGVKIDFMMQYFRKKNDWHELHKAISNLNDRTDLKAKIERKTLNKLNLAHQAMFYVISADPKSMQSTSALKCKAELQLNNTIQHISFLQVERKEKLRLYNNLKFAIDDMVATRDPEWAKVLISLCIQSIESFEKNKVMNKY